jgi:hypothetical protein
MRLLVVSFGLVAALVSASAPARSARLSPPWAALPEKKQAQYLVVYDSGVAGEYPGEYARYSIPQLSPLEASPATGVGSAPAFDANGLPAFLDESSNGGFGMFEQPNGSGMVAAQQLFYGVPCDSSSLSVDGAGNFFVAQYCKGDVLEFSPGKSKKAKKPRAVYTGGNFGGPSQPNPTVAAADSTGALYVGDYSGGITYFAAGSLKPVVALPFGMSQLITQIFIDAKGDAWSTHFGDPTAYYFQNETDCVLDPSGTVVRNEVGEHFSKGRFVSYLYTAPTDSKAYAQQGESIAVDTSGRVYIGADSDGKSVVMAYESGQSCPDLKSTVLLEHAADPQVAVDASGRHYVSDYVENTLSEYKSGGTKPIAQITQPTGFVNPTHLVVGP